jgi:hypothetical protein
MLSAYLRALVKKLMQDLFIYFIAVYRIPRNV